MAEELSVEESLVAQRLLRDGSCSDCGAQINTLELAVEHARFNGFACDEHSIRSRRLERSCGGCAHLSEDGLLCDHHAKADAENDEVDALDPNADDASVELGRQIIAWDDSDQDAECPGLEAS